ncbi:MAG: hypothetical protein DMG57_25615 [Acidobacteria bacterium]|nr:MAG: hypothetical protein DMG57_25615 [Acidobacteriota bacterium]
MGTVAVLAPGLASDTSRWAAINAMYYEKSGDGQAREDAFRSLNYSTYFAASDGRIACCGLDYADSYWFDDGYGDHIRNYLWAMGAIPEFAPVGENHLLHSSSVVQDVEYGERKIRYRTFDRSATEVLRLSFKPADITAGGQTLSERGDLREPGYTIRALAGGDYFVRIRHLDSNEISIS